jgi:hypothetical protein
MPEAAENRMSRGISALKMEEANRRQKRTA